MESYGDENWEDAIRFCITIEEIMDEKEVKEKIAKHLGIEQIRYYIKDGNIISLVCGEAVGNDEIKNIRNQVIDECINALADYFGYNDDNQECYRLLNQMKIE